MLRLKRRHRRNVLLGLLVLLVLSWASLGCYACELGTPAPIGADEHAAHAGADGKGCHEKAPSAPCPHCAAMGDGHDGAGGCDSAACTLYKVAADEQVGWSPASADQDLDFYPLLLSASPTLLDRQTRTARPTRLTTSTHLDTHPTAAFCVLLI
jgi:hypothetical protein